MELASDVEERKRSMLRSARHLGKEMVLVSYLTTTTTKARLSTVALLLVTVTAAWACNGDTSSNDGAPANDATNNADSTAMDSPNANDGGPASDVTNNADDMTPLDSGNSNDGNTADVRDSSDAGDAADTESSMPTLLPVNLGSAGSYVVLAQSGISDVPVSAITGDLGISPAAATFITGFSLIADSTNVFARAPQVTGRVYAADDAPPTPSNLTTAVGDMYLAFTDAAGRAASVTELAAGNIGGMTLSPGVYRWGTGLLIPTNISLNGGATGVWIFQIAGGLTVSNAVQIALSGGALPKNVFWQVAGSVQIGTTAHFEGVILCHTSIALGTGASINGRLFAQTAVTLEGNTVVQPAP